MNLGIIPDGVRHDGLARWTIRFEDGSMIVYDTMTHTHVVIRRRATPARLMARFWRACWVVGSG